jgi:peroxiredoxin
VVAALSADAAPSLKVFAEELDLPFPLLSDFKDRYVTHTYGIYNDRFGVPRRRTYVIDKNGVIVKVIVDDKDMQAHSVRALEAVKELQAKEHS